MYYPEQVIEEVRSKNDIVDVISSSIGLQQKGESFWACCPFHNEKTPSFSVSRKVQMYNCFGCHNSGNVFTFVMEYEQMTFPEAIKYLADRAGVKLPEESLSEEDKKKISKQARMKDMNRAAAGYYYLIMTGTEKGTLGLEYYKKRGFTKETIDKFGLGYACVGANLRGYLKNEGYTDAEMYEAGLIHLNEESARDVFWNRVMVPIFDINGKVIGFGGRVLGDGEPKYLNTKDTPIFDKSHTLFAMHIAKKSKKHGMILCEGYMDVIAMHQAGFDNATASLGTAFTMGQANIIKRYTKDVYLAYDSDGAGRKATVKAIDILKRMDMNQRVIDLSPYKDPDEFIKNLGQEEFEKRINSAVSGTTFLIEKLEGESNLNDPDGKAEFIHGAAKIISEIKDVAVRSTYIESVCSKYIIDKDMLKQYVTQYGLEAESMESKYGQRYDDYRRERMGGAVGYTNGVSSADDVAEGGRLPSGKNNADVTNQSLLLTWMVNDLSLFERLKGVIGREDFVGEIIRPVADAIFDQYEKDKKVNLAKILDGFDSLESQKIAASIVQTELKHSIEEEQTKKALTDIIRKVKMVSLEAEMARLKESGSQDGIELMAVIRKKAEINRFKI